MGHSDAPAMTIKAFATKVIEILADCPDSGEEVVYTDSGDPVTGIRLENVGGGGNVIFIEYGSESESWRTPG